MPNWCFVCATFKSNINSRIKKLKEELLNENDFSYTKLIPEPFEFLTFDDEGNLIEHNEVNEISVIKDEDITDDIKPYICQGTERHIHGCSIKPKGYTVINWYEWRIDNYGVKWDVDKNSSAFYKEYFDTEAFVNFESPWTYPKPILDLICKKYKVDCEFSAEESGCGIYDIGKIQYHEGSDEITTVLEEYENEIDYLRALGDEVIAYVCDDCDYIFKDDELSDDEEIECPSCGCKNYKKY
ncbi:hypothetical protein [Clostridium baratii]|nr:hypothetical protein [Clostridium baratii]